MTAVLTLWAFVLTAALTFIITYTLVTDSMRDARPIHETVIAKTLEPLK